MDLSQKPQTSLESDTQNIIPGTDKLNLQKELVSQEKVFDEKLMSVEHKSDEWKSSPGSLIPSTVQCLIDAERLLFEQQYTVQLGGDILNDAEHANKQRPDISTEWSDAEHANKQRPDISTAWSAPRGGFDGTLFNDLIDVADDKPVEWAPPPPPPPTDPPNPDT